MPNEIKHRYTKTYSLNVNANSLEVFPVICETSDHSLYSNVKYELVYSISGLAEDNCIFKTSNSSEKIENYWHISSFDPNREIQLVKYDIQSISLIKFLLTDIDDSKCKIEIQYSITQINQKESAGINIQKEAEDEIIRFKQFFVSKFDEVLLEKESISASELSSENP